MSAKECDTMQRRGRLVIIIRRQYTHSDVNVISALIGSRYKLILRTHVISLVRELSRKQNGSLRRERRLQWVGVFGYLIDVANCVQETDPSKQPQVDPFAAVEKGTNQMEAQKKVLPRLTQIGEANETTWSDPYAMNQKLRAKHRVERRQEHAANRSNLEIKDRYALPEDMRIVDDEGDVNESRSFKQVQQRRRSAPKSGDLKTSLLSNTRKKMDPFGSSSGRIKFKKN